MKRINLFLMATVVAFGSFFSSCTPDEVTTVKISLDSEAIASGAAVTGNITALGGLQSVTLLDESGATVTGWPVTSFAVGSSVVGTAGVYTVRIAGLADGVYTLRATDKKAVEDNVKFAVGTITALASETTIYCTLSDGSNNSTCASADGTTYAANAATAAQQANIDFVYFNAGGTSYGIYAPSAVPTALTTTFAAWTVKNATTYAKTTTITYATATFAEVKAAADAATATSVTGLAANNVVVFKTAAGKVGIFKVNSITPGFLAIDNVKINIKVQQ